MITLEMEQKKVQEKLKALIEAFENALSGPGEANHTFWLIERKGLVWVLYQRFNRHH